MRLRRLLRLGVVLGLLSGCTASTAGTPVASSPPPTAAVAAPTSGPEPGPARNPRDARAITACQLLGDAELRAVDLDPATAELTSFEARTICSWEKLDGSNVTGINLYTPMESTLVNVYAVRERFAFFRTWPDIGGNPALHAEQVVNEGACTLYVALSDDQVMAIDTGAGRPLKTDACTEAERVAAAILAYLPPR